MRLSNGIPKPIEHEALEGYPGKRKKKVSFAQEYDVPGIGKPYVHMRPLAKEKWIELAETWKYVLKATDREMFRQYCEIWVDMRSAEDMYYVQGHVVPTEKGGWKKSPYFQVAMDCRDRLNRMCQEFGATPAARARVAKEIDDPNSNKNKSKFKGLMGQQAKGSA